jgi:hypothetical protein
LQKARQVRSASTIERILDAALVTFRAEGFRGAGIAAICKAAGISPGNLYHYFDSKEDIVAAIVARDRALLTRTVAGLIARDDPVEAIIAAIIAEPVPGEFGLDPVMTTEIYAEASRNPVVARIVQDFARQTHAEVVAMLAMLRDRGLVAKETDLAAVAGLLMALVDGILTRRLADRESDPAALADPLRVAIGAVLGVSTKDDRRD